MLIYIVVVVIFTEHSFTESNFYFSSVETARNNETEILQMIVTVHFIFAIILKGQLGYCRI